MPGDNPRASQLNGWKEIASYIGKGARTAQRWEVEYGLPVRRAGEAVFALVEELDAWRAAQATRAELLTSPDTRDPQRAPEDPAHAGAEPAPNAKAAPSWPLKLAGLAILALAVPGVAWVSTRGSRPQTAGGLGSIMPDRSISSWRVEQESLIALDAAGTVLWRHEIPGLTPRPADDPQDVTVGDLDGDGRPELVLAAATTRRSDRSVYCFEHDGAIRFVHRPNKAVRFGGMDYHPPWIGSRVFTFAGADGRRSLWVASIHGLWFPSMLQELDPRGSVLREYWSNGYIGAVDEATFDGRSVLLVGAGNNEHRGASLSIVPRDAVSGAAPATDPHYQCTSCGPARPLEFLVFPGNCISRALDGQPTVTEAWIEGQAQIVARVAIGVPELARAGTPAVAEAIYTITPAFAGARASFPPSFTAVHRMLEKAGRLDHPFDSESHERSALPVLRWSGDRFVPLPSSGPPD